MGGDAQVGETVAGYVLEAPLGRGSTSQVFLGRHSTIGRRAAIKVLALSAMESEDNRRRLLQEARAVADIRHPHIAEVWDFHESVRPPRVALVMELVEGPTLEVLRGAPLDPRRAREVAQQLVGAMRAAHSAGVVHRDLKPGNLVFAEDPRPPGVRPHVYVVDFGLAKRLGGAGMVKTVAGAMLGTPAYMAPEQIVGRPAPSAATDVYAVAELVYELFTGERAFAKDGAEALLDEKMRGEVPELPLPEPIRQDLQDVLRACLAKAPERRPGLDALAAALDGLGARALSIPAGATALAAPPVPRGSDGAWVPRRGGRQRERDLATGVVAAEEVRGVARRLAEDDLDAPTGSDLDVSTTRESFPRLAPADHRGEVEGEDDEGLATELAGAPPVAAELGPEDDVTPLRGSPGLPRHAGGGSTAALSPLRPSGTPPPADSVLRPLDVARAMGRTPSKRRSVVVDTGEAADLEAETMPPAEVESALGGTRWWGAVIFAAGLAAAGAALWWSL